MRTSQFCASAKIQCTLFSYQSKVSFTTESLSLQETGCIRFQKVKECTEALLHKPVRLHFSTIYTIDNDPDSH